MADVARWPRAMGSSANFLQTVINSSSNPEAQLFTISSPPYRIVHINPAWTKLCGSHAESVGQPCQIMQGANAEPEALSQLKAGLREHRFVRVRLTCFMAAGRQFAGELTVMPLMDEVGQVKHLCGTLRVVNKASAPASAMPFVASLADSAAAAAFLAHTDRRRGIQPVSANMLGADLSAEQEFRPDASKSRTVLGDIEGLHKPPAAAQDALLSRESFPLYTLDNHPIAPVLLRMMQLNNSSASQKLGACDKDVPGSSSIDSTADGSEASTMIAAADARGDSAFIPGSSLCRPRNLDLSQEFLEAVNAQGVLSQQTWPPGMQFGQMGADRQSSNASQSSMSPTFAPSVQPPSPRVFPTAEQSSTAAYRACNGCGYCPTCCNTSGSQKSNTRTDGISDGTLEDGHLPHSVRGIRKRVCDGPQNFAPPQQPPLTSVQQETQLAQQQQQTCTGKHWMDGPLHARHVQQHQQAQQRLRAQHAQAQAALSNEQANEMQRLLREQQEDDDTVEHSESRPMPSSALALDEEPLAQSRRLELGELEGPGHDQEQVGGALSAAGEPAAAPREGECSMDEENVEIDDMLDVLDSFWSESMDATDLGDSAQDNPMFISPLA